MKPGSLLFFTFYTILGFSWTEAMQSVHREAPAMGSAALLRQRDLGAWDDVFVPDDQDMIVLRRGATLFSLSMTQDDGPRKLSAASTLTQSRIVTSAAADGRLWLLMESPRTAPFAIDARTGEVSEFTIAGLTIPGSHAPEIQSYVVARHVGAVIVQIGAGDRETWPRDGRPLYFWMSLQSGKVIPFPIGWDLRYFSADQSIAVFETPRGDDSRKRSTQAVEMATGRSSEEAPDRAKEAHIPFRWTETQAVKPLYVRRAETGGREHFAGISLNGRALRFDLHLEQVFYFRDAKVENGFVGVRLRREGGSWVEPGPLWLVGAKNPADPELVAPAVTDFAVLEGGNSVFSTTGHGPKGASSEVFFRVFSDKSSWNALDGVPRLPELERLLAEKVSIQDALTVRLIRGFGPQSPIVLCLFDHVRGDMRALVPGDAPLLPGARWKRAVLLTSKGERYMTGLFREATLPDFIWLHNSGRIFTGFARGERIELAETALGLTPEARR